MQVRIQTEAKYTSIWSCIRDTYRQERVGLGPNDRGWDLIAVPRDPWAQGLGIWDITGYRTKSLSPGERTQGKLGI